MPSTRAGVGLLTFLRAGIRTLENTGTGPLWFVQTLLGFSIIAALAAASVPGLVRRMPQAATPRPLRSAPAFASLIATGLGVGAVSFVFRQWFPLMTAVSNLQIGFFTQYVVYFVLGMASGGAFDNGLDAYTTGLRWQALAYALWPWSSRWRSCSSPGAG